MVNPRMYYPSREIIHQQNFLQIHTAETEWCLALLKVYPQNNTTLVNGRGASKGHICIMQYYLNACLVFVSSSIAIFEVIILIINELVLILSQTIKIKTLYIIRQTPWIYEFIKTSCLSLESSNSFITYLMFIGLFLD